MASTVTITIEHPNAPAASLHRDLPAELTDDLLSKARKDAEVLIAAFQDHPNDLKHLAHAALNGDFQTAKELRKQLQLGEEDFTAAGGGLIWLVVIAVAVILLYPGDAY